MLVHVMLKGNHQAVKSVSTTHKNNTRRCVNPRQVTHREMPRRHPVRRTEWASEEKRGKVGEEPMTIDRIPGAGMPGKLMNRYVICAHLPPTFKDWRDSRLASVRVLARLMVPSIRQTARNRCQSKLEPVDEGLPEKGARVPPSDVTQRVFACGILCQFDRCQTDILSFLLHFPHNVRSSSLE
ncbi:hypothetical protein ZHAS_00012986 [Anopheles sinensis]|uniref:Uncharacterized protein n=1 Tax=Anopheles sinensis TaxID=74873 RepID=A0A084W499_ANOSI|nr:hypothetical protein ZHAS_00012986 [Anopheles sinensis]